VTTRREYGSGSIRRYRDGYRAELRYLDPETKKDRRTSFTGKTRREVEKQMLDARVLLAQHKPIIEAGDTVQAAVHLWMTTSWSHLKPTTIQDKKYIIERRLIGELGDLRLRDLDDAVIAAWQARLLEDGLSPDYVQKIRRQLAQVLDLAVERGELRRNVVRSVPPPRATASETHWFTSEEVAALLYAAKGDRIEPMLTFIAHSGVRKGEALALRWQDVDEKQRKASISGTLARIEGKLTRQDPKTNSSIRRIDLTDEASDALAQARAIQTHDEAASSAWLKLGYVFTTASGEPIDPRNALRSFTRIRSSAGFSSGDIHSLRHSFATYLLLSGTPVEVVSKHLGHARTSITMDVYSHATEEDRSEAIKTGASGYAKRGMQTGNVVPLRRARSS
jgi:integrase